MGNQLKYKIGTFSRNRACIGASTGHRPRYFFLQYLYRYETAVPGGFFQKKKCTNYTQVRGTRVPGYLRTGTVSRRSERILVQVLSGMHTILYVKTFEDAGSGQK